MLAIRAALHNHGAIVELIRVHDRHDGLFGCQPFDERCYILGHSRPSITLDIYTHRVQDNDRAAAEGDYDRCLRLAVDLAPVLDRFFVEVLVMAEDAAVFRQEAEALPA